MQQPPRDPRLPQPGYRPPTGPPPMPPPAARPQPPAYGGGAYPPPGPPLNATPPPTIPVVGAKPPVRKNRGALKFVAISCVITAWLTLVLSLLGAGWSFVVGVGAAATAAHPPSTAISSLPSGTPSVPGLPGTTGLPSVPGGDSNEEGFPTSPFGGPGGGTPMAGAAGFLTQFIAPLCFIGGAFELVTGVSLFFLFLGLGQAFYVLIDLDEQSVQAAQMLQIIINRLGTAPGGR